MQKIAFFTRKTHTHKNMLEEQIISFFGGFGVWVVVFVCACLPVLETRIAIPLGCASSIWGASAMSVWGSTFVAFLGSSLVGILIILTLMPLLKVLKKGKKTQKLVFKIEKFFEEKLKFKNKKSKLKTIIFLTTFIALPIPLLGVYTGAGVCVFLKLKWWQSMLCLLIGNLINCVLIAVFCFLLYSFIPLLLTILVVILALFALWEIINLIYDQICKKHTKKT